MKYSITIPAYKARFFDECLQSVLSQTVDDYEVIVLNDCSPEDIKGIADRHACPRLRYYENERNVGAVDVVDNWNRLLELAQGDFVICMGDDDKLAPDCLEQYDRLMQQHPGLDVYHARVLSIDEKSQVCNIQDDRPDWESAYSFMWHSSRISYIGDFCLRASVLRQQGGYVKFPLALSSDHATVELVAKRLGIANMHKPVFLYRSSHYTITSSGDARLEVEASELKKQWDINFLSDEPQDEIDRLYKRLYLESMDARVLRNRTEYMGADMSRHALGGLFYWLKNANRYQIPKMNVAYAFLKSFYYRKQGYYNR